jgi:hypothetical protein
MGKRHCAIRADGLISVLSEGRRCVIRTIPYNGGYPAIKKGCDTVGSQCEIIAEPLVVTVGVRGSAPDCNSEVE